MSDEDPEIQAWIDQAFERVFATIQTNKAKLKDELLPLLGLMSVEFNLVERDFKYLLILLRDDLPLPEARKIALKCKRFYDVLEKVKRLFPTKFRDPAIVEEFEEIAKEADDLREERNLMLHSVWLTTSDPEKPFVRLKEDEREPEIDFDVPTVEKLVDRMTKFRGRAHDFFCKQVAWYAELPAILYDSKPPLPYE